MATAPQLQLEPSARAAATTSVMYWFDPAAAIGLSLLAAPVILATGLVVAVLSRRSPFIAHERIGTAGAPFWMWKLRTMWRRGEHRTGKWTLVEYVREEHAPRPKHAGDERVCSRFAAFCRTYSLDELPQIFHVISGRMSLVGPRPITRGELRQYYGPAATWEILTLRPGLTGLWQIQGRNSLSYSERRELDLRLVRSFGVRTYVSILLRTVPRVVSGADSY